MMAVPSSAVTAVYVIGQIVMIAGKDILTRAHGALVFDRRVRIIAANLAKEIPIRAEVLDVGTGDGSIAKDVLHHTGDARILLREAARVSRRHIVIKDHLREGLFAKATLQAMDWVSNYGHEVALPYNYVSKREWHEHFRDTNLNLEHWTEGLQLYPFPFSPVFGRRLHFIARLTISSLGNAPFGGRAECHTDRSAVGDAAGMTL